MDSCSKFRLRYKYTSCNWTHPCCIVSSMVIHSKGHHVKCYQQLSAISIRWVCPYPLGHSASQLCISQCLSPHKSDGECVKMIGQCQKGLVSNWKWVSIKLNVRSYREHKSSDANVRRSGSYCQKYRRVKVRLFPKMPIDSENMWLLVLQM